MEAFPNRVIPHHTTFTNVHIRLREICTFCRPNVNAGRQREVRTVEVEERILRRVENTPDISTRALGQELGIGHATVWRVLHEDFLYPYHVQRVQGLNDQDYAHRIAFSQLILERIAQDPDFTSFIFFTDEAHFSRDGITNFHNIHEWAHENPHSILESRNQFTFSLNVWADIFGDKIIGPIFLAPRLTYTCTWTLFRPILWTFLMMNLLMYVKECTSCMTEPLPTIQEMSEYSWILFSHYDGLEGEVHYPGQHVRLTKTLWISSCGVMLNHWSTMATPSMILKSFERES